MPHSIDRDELRRLVAEAATLVEVLPAQEFGEDHLPGAVNLPLRRLETEAPSQVDPSRPVIVYWLGRCLRHEPQSRVAARN